MSAQKQAAPDHPIHELLARRWSPYAFADRAVSEDDLCSLFEAARWAASSYNEQPWSYLVATKANPNPSSGYSPAWSRGTRPEPGRRPCWHWAVRAFALNDKPSGPSSLNCGV
jgi:hypothetical protein